MRIRREERNRAWVAIALLAVVVAFLGGSSRPDAIQIIALRPLIALFLIPVFYWITREQLADFRALLIFATFLVVWTIIQQVPLPPAIWQSLPGREPVSAVGEALGMPSIWRPISLVPARTSNALVSMLVPITGLLLAIAVGIRPTVLLLIVVGLGIFNAVLGILQILGGHDSALYFYEITNWGAPVGIFANQNHSAVFGSIGLLIIGYLLTVHLSYFGILWHRVGLVAAWLFLLVAALIGGSRAGLLTTFLALLATGLMFWMVRGSPDNDNGSGGWMRRVLSSKAAMLGVFSAFIIGMIAVFWLFQRVPALEQLTEIDNFEDFRFYLWQPLAKMVADFWLFGSGLGSFEEVYHIYEPTELLFPSYVNQAHNDWVQLLIEGGLPAVMLVIAVGVWMANRAKRIFAEERRALPKLIFWAAVLAIISFASLVDYPLRTPIFQLVSVWLLVAFSRNDIVVPAKY